MHFNKPEPELSKNNLNQTYSTYIEASTGVVVSEIVALLTKDGIGVEWMSGCNMEFMKHIFPVLTNPRGAAINGGFSRNSIGILDINREVHKPVVSAFVFDGRQGIL